MYELLISIAGLTILVAGIFLGRTAHTRKTSSVASTQVQVKLPDKNFTLQPEKTHDPADLVFTFDQLEYYYRVPGEFTHRLYGEQYGFEALSFIITETHPGGGPGFHVHDTEEAHIVLEGSVQYQINERIFTIQAPYVAKIPSGVPHTFMNIGNKPFNLIAVFASKNPNTHRIGPNPLVAARQNHGES